MRGMHNDVQPLDQFIQHAHMKLKRNPYNAFLDQTCTPALEKHLQNKLARLKHPEFCGDASTWPSLFISTQAFQTSQYHQRVRLDRIDMAGVRYEVMPIAHHRLFNLKAIQPDPERALNDWMVLRALDAPYTASVLWLNEELWMVDAPSEQATIDPVAARAHGHILSFGLGLGYYVLMADLNPNILSHTVVEQNAHVIELFQRHIQPQLKLTRPLTLIHARAQDLFKKEHLAHYDHVFVDIHQSAEDGLARMVELLEQTNPIHTSLDFWIESSCTQVLPSLILQAKAAQLQDKALVHPNPLYQRIHQKIERTLNLEYLNDVAALQACMYNPELHRRILAAQ
jgi:hypothetical protein